MSTLDCITPPNPSGLCRCGCGKRTNLAAQTDNRCGQVRGHPVKFIMGHNWRRSPVDFIVDEETGCWNWQGARRENDGYGQRWKDGKLQHVHRLAWEEKNGPIPDGLCALHHCDNPQCANPDHIFLGTRADNNADKERKGRARHARGERCGAAKLTEADVRTIRATHDRGGVTCAALAKEYKVSAVLISMVVRRVAWRHIL